MIKIDTKEYICKNCGVLTTALPSEYEDKPCPACEKKELRPKVDEISAGDSRSIDDYVDELKKAGFEADYENIYSDTIGFLAKVYVSGEEHAVFEARAASGSMVRTVITPLDEIER